MGIVDNRENQDKRKAMVRAMTFQKNIFIFDLWKVVSGILGCEVPQTIEEKKEMLLKHHIAVWDVIQSCEIEGSSDASIRDVIPNDLSEILRTADIQAIYTNGGKAYELYQKYIYPVNGIKAHKLPSTSPANAGYSLERLKEAWKQIGEYIH